MAKTGEESTGKKWSHLSSYFINGFLLRVGGREKKEPQKKTALSVQTL